MKSIYTLLANLSMVTSAKDREEVGSNPPGRQLDQSLSVCLEGLTHVDRRTVEIYHNSIGNLRTRVDIDVSRDMYISYFTIQIKITCIIQTKLLTDLQ